MLKINILETIKEIDILIEQNNKLVKQGKNNLESKYFYITKEMLNYIESIILHNEKEVIDKIKLKPRINIIDVFAGGGLFTLMFSKFLLLLCVKENLNLELFQITLNDKIYDDISIIDSDILKMKFTEIYNNINKMEFISTVSYDISIYDNQLDKFIEDKAFNIIIANPMYSSISKGKEDLIPISFLNEDIFLQNEGIKNLIKNLITKSDYFIYLTKQLETNLTIDSHKNIKIYLNDYTDLTITEIEKIRYEIFNFTDLEKMKEQNFWKFTTNQKENFNTVILFEKNKIIKKSKLKYVYNAIYGTNEQNSVKNKINKIKLKLKKLTLDNILDKYNTLKGQL